MNSSDGARQRLPVRGRQAPTADPWADVRRAAAGDSEAFGQLYAYYAPLIERHIRLRTGNAATAEDLTGQVFLNAYQSIARFREIEGKPFVSWLYNIANNLVVDYYRERRRDGLELRPESAATSAGPEDAAAHDEMREALERFIRRLKPEQRLILTLRLVDGLKPNEIAELLGKNSGAVRVSLFRILVNLRRELRLRGLYD